MDTWSQEVSLQFIEMYKARPMLWNPDDKHYYNKNVKSKQWEEIAEAMGTTYAICQRKMSCLLSSFRRVRSKQRQEKRLTGRNPRHEKWFAYESLKFLLKRRKRRYKCDEAQNEVNVFEDYEEAPSPASSAPPPAASPSVSPPPAEGAPPSPAPRLRIKLEPLRRAATSTAERADADGGGAPRACANRVEVDVQDTELTDSGADECYFFGNFVANKLKHYSWRTRSSVQHAISNILYNADQETCDGMAGTQRDPFGDGE